MLRRSSASRSRAESRYAVSTNPVGAVSSGGRCVARDGADLALEAARDLNAISATAIAADMPRAATDTIPAGVRPDAPTNGADGEEPAFLLGYAHEAMARAHRLLGDEEQVEFHRAEAWRLADEVVDAEARGQLLADLDSLRDAPAAA